MPRLPRGRRTTVGAALVAVSVLATAVVLLELRSPRQFESVITAAPDAAEPVALIAAAARAHRFVFVSDINGAAAPKRLAAEVVDRLARSRGLDALVVGIASDQQLWIDRFMQSGSADESALTTNPRAAGGAGLPLLPLFRQLRELNRELGATRSVRVIAAGRPGWPPQGPLSPGQALARYAERDLHMLHTLEESLLEREPRARVVFFVDGLHATRLPYVLRTGGTAPIRIEPLARRLAVLHPREVWNAMVDASTSSATAVAVAGYSGTAAREPLRRQAGGRAFAVPTTPALGNMADWIRVATQPGIEFEHAEPAALLTAGANAYVYLPD
jgi:hypothetical protein